MSKQRILASVVWLTLLHPLLLQAGNSLQGKLFYQKGESVEKATVTIAGGIPANIQEFPCQSCHREDGGGGYEGGVRVPPINWRALTVRRPSQQHSAYNEALIKRAIGNGIGNAGQTLHPLMPRYQLSDTDYRNLFDYLQKLSNGLEIGVNNDLLRMGIVLTDNKAFNDVTVLIKDLLRAFFQQINNKGGIYGRTIEPIFTNPENLRKDVLCYFAILIPSSETNALQRIIDTGIPIIFPISHPQVRQKSSVTFQASFADQLASLFALITETEERPRKLTLIVDKNLQGKHLIEKLETLLSPEETFNVIQINEDGLAMNGSQSLEKHILWFSENVQHLQRFFNTHELRGETVTLYSSIDLMGDLLSNQQLPAKPFRLILSNPRGTPDTGSKEYRQYQAFQQKYKLPKKYTEWQRTTYLAASLLVEALKQSGRKITRHSLFQAATSIHNLSVGVTPPVTTSDAHAKPSQILEYIPESRSLKSIR